MGDGWLVETGNLMTPLIPPSLITISSREVLFLRCITCSNTSRLAEAMVRQTAEKKLACSRCPTASDVTTGHRSTTLAAGAVSISSCHLTLHNLQHVSWCKRRIERSRPRGWQRRGQRRCQ